MDQMLYKSQGKLRIYILYKLMKILYVKIMYLYQLSNQLLKLIILPEWLQTFPVRADQSPVKVHSLPLLITI